MRVAAVTIVAAHLLTGTVWSQATTHPARTVVLPPNIVSAPLDGRQFSARIVRDGEDGKNQPLGDHLIFSGGKFSSEICKKFNFSDAPYWIRMEGDEVHFLAELTSPTDGKMVWQGVVRGDTLEGTMRWTKKRWYWTIDAEHQIRGKLEKGPAPISRKRD